MSGCASSSAPLAGSRQYAFSVTVRLTMATVGAHRASSRAAGSSGAASTRPMLPITAIRSASPRRFSAYRPSCGASAFRVSGLRRLAAVMPQRASPAASTASV